MSINMSIFSREITEAHQKVLDLNNPTNWALFTCSANNELKVTETGTGGLEELKDEFEGSKVHYAFVRVLDPTSNLPRFVLIAWCGDGVPVGLKGRFNMHVNDVARVLTGFHVQINARSEEDVEPDTIMAKVISSSGAHYSIQKDTKNPSLAKPAAPKPFKAPPVTRSYVAPVPTKPLAAPVTAAPAVSQTQPASQSEPKHLFESVGTNYQPIKTAPKKLGSNPFAEAEAKMAAENSNEDLRRSTGSRNSVQNRYQPGTTESKPVSSSYEPVRTNPKPLGSNSSINYSQETEAVTNSSYQPIKLNPKPLYGEGVATATYQAPATTESNFQAPQFRANSGFQPPPPTIEDDVAKRMENIRIQEEQDLKEKQQREEQARQQELARQERERELAEAKRIQEESEKKRLEQEQMEREREYQQQQDAQRMMMDENEQTQHMAGNGTTATCLYDYEKSEDNEISIFDGEIITNIIEVEESWWHGTNSKGEAGLFPATYVQKHVPESEPTREPMALPTMPEPVPQLADELPSAIILFDYLAQDDNELTLVQDQLVKDIVFVSEDWWQGTLNGVVGLFPANYVELRQ